MRRILLASKWTAAALAVAMLAFPVDVRGQDEPRSRNKSGGGGSKDRRGDGKSGSGGGGGSNSGGGGTQGGGAKPPVTKPPVVKPPVVTPPVTKPPVIKPPVIKPPVLTPPVTKPPAKKPPVVKPPVVTPPVMKPPVKKPPVITPPGVGGTGKPNGNNKGPGKKDWDSWTKNGWNKNGWNNNFNSQHHYHHHGYWNNGIWILPIIIAVNQPWVYLQPRQPIVSGQKWLGVTYEPYDGGGAYVTGIYEGSPAQRVGLEVGDVIVSLDGVDATNLGSVIQAANNNVILQVLNGRTGDLVQKPVSLIE